jgi:NADP-dependent 3-hydroxy acid dehydrogenase YdfG
VQAALGPIDVLVNSAGAAQRSPVAELTAAHWAAAMQAKFFTTIHALQAVLPGMAARGRGAVVNIVGAGGKMASPIHLPGGSANAALMLASAGLVTAATNAEHRGPWRVVDWRVARAMPFQGGRTACLPCLTNLPIC